ncbi:MAG: helix-hairpin-helix domain-containing protein [Anaerovoracaceae bacterium]
MKIKPYLTKEYLFAHKEQAIKLGAILLILMVALFVFIFRTGEKEEIALESEAATAKVEDEYAGKIIVDVGGAVSSPKVVELAENSRIGDAIDAAGGLLETADISSINRAAVVKDGDKIFVPTAGEEGAAAPGPGGTSGQSQKEGKVNINTATSAELQTITGVGPATAEKILLYRSTNGSFAAPEDLKKVDGIGDKTFEKIKDFITI